MKTIDLNQVSLIDTKVTSSKGNQLKWLVKNNWYKADHMGYEGLCEVVVSKLLEQSNISDFVSYLPIRISFDHREQNGCYSRNFRKKNKSLVTLEHLSKQWLANSFARELAKYSDVKEKIRRTVAFVEKVTRLENVEKYITTMLELDAFFLNEDRHTNNIAFILDEDTGEYSYCPYFDFGLSLLADTSVDYPIGGDIYEMLNRIHAKPFDRDFDRQMDAAQGLYGDFVRFHFENNDIETVLTGLDEYYSGEVIARVKALLYYQKHKYQYMFR